MELSEALKIIDTTSGMLQFLLFEVQAGELKDKFLLTPVHKSVETFYDPDINCYKTECREHYTYMSSGEERKAYVVDVSPACDYLLNEWPSPTATRIRKVMAEVFFNSMDEWKEILGNDIGPALGEGYDYERFFVARGEHPRVLYDVLIDTFHEMNHVLGLTDEELFGEGSEEEAPSIPSEIDEELINKLVPLFNSEEEAQKFPNRIKGLDDKKITILVSQLWLKEVIADTTTKKDLWQVLHDAGLYTKGISTWNGQVKKPKKENEN